jgi:hypothetical protein
MKVYNDYQLAEQSEILQNRHSWKQIEAAQAEMTQMQRIL